MNTERCFAINHHNRTCVKDDFHGGRHQDETGWSWETLDPIGKKAQESFGVVCTSNDSYSAVPYLYVVLARDGSMIRATFEPTGLNMVQMNKDFGQSAPLELVKYVPAMMLEEYSKAHRKTIDCVAGRLDADGIATADEAIEALDEYIKMRDADAAMYDRSRKELYGQAVAALHGYDDVARDIGAKTERLRGRLDAAEKENDDGHDFYP